MRLRVLPSGELPIGEPKLVKERVCFTPPADEVNQIVANKSFIFNQVQPVHRQVLEICAKLKSPLWGKTISHRIHAGFVVLTLSKGVPGIANRVVEFED